MADFQAISELHERSPDPFTWAQEHQPDESLIYRSGVDHQARQAMYLARMLGLNLDRDVKVISHHTSKSVHLPVSAFRLSGSNGQSIAAVRDNFHDLNIGIVSDTPLHLPHSVLFAEKSQEWYDAKKRDAKESDDRRGPTEKRDPTMWENDDWYADYSGGCIVRHDGRLFVHQTTFSQGLDMFRGPNDNSFDWPYKDGCEGCKVYAWDWFSAATILDTLKQYLQGKTNLELCSAAVSDKSKAGGCRTFPMLG